MSYIQCQAWPRGGDTQLSDVIGWPLTVTNAREMLGLPAITPPVTLDQAAIFHLRALEATVDFTVASPGGSTTQTLPLKRYWDLSAGVALQILQDEEYKLIPGTPDTYIWRPWWYGDSGPVDLGGGSFINFQISFNTEYLWSQENIDKAVFNLRAAVHCVFNSGSDEVEFNANEYYRPATSGTFDLSLAGDSATGLSATIFPLTLKAALDGLGDFGTVTVTSETPGLYFVVWDTRNQAVPALVGDGTNLLPASDVLVTVIKEGDETRGTQAKQMIELRQNPQPGPDGPLEIYGGILTMHGSGTVSPPPDTYTFSIGNFTPTLYLRYTKDGANDPTYNPTTGVELHPPAMP